MGELAVEQRGILVNYRVRVVTTMNPVANHWSSGSCRLDSNISLIPMATVQWGSSTSEHLGFLSSSHAYTLFWLSGAMACLQSFDCHVAVSQVCILFPWWSSSPLRFPLPAPPSCVTRGKPNPLIAYSWVKNLKLTGSYYFFSLMNEGNCKRFYTVRNNQFEGPLP